MNHISFKIIISCIVFNLFATSAVATGGLKIPNNCDNLFPKELREQHNSVQYRTNYTTCINNYNQYISTLEEVITDWEEAEKTNTSKDWNKVKEGLQNNYSLMNSYGELLTDWFNRDILMQDINDYIKLINEKQIKAKEIEQKKFYNFMSIGITNNLKSLSGSSSYSGSIEGQKLIKSKNDSCKKNKRTGKCYQLKNPIK